MSLTKQLSSGFFIILLLVFLVSLIFNVVSTRQFIETQLQSHAQDTATSLGLSITPYIGDNTNLPIIETMTNAIFDRGYYNSILLKNAQHNVLIEKKSDQKYIDVPQWFIKTFSIRAPSASTEINGGWVIEGYLVVESNPSYGYLQLWLSAKQSAAIILAAFLFSLLFVWLLIKKIVQAPLNSVVAQANDISHQKFQMIEKVPSTRELSQIVIALNAMSKSLSTMFNRILSQSEEYRKFAYVDSLTAQGNRRAFTINMNNVLRGRHVGTTNYLVIARASSLNSINKNSGMNAGDIYLLSMVALLRSSAVTYLETPPIFRLNGADIAMIAENCDSETAQNIAKQFIRETKRKEKSEHESGFAHLGVTSFVTGDSLHTILEKADSALAKALQNDKSWQLADDLNVFHSNTDWKEILTQIVERQHATFVKQPIVDKTNSEPVYFEWFARFHHDNHESAPMDQLIPASVRLDFSQVLDKLIVANMLIQIAPQSTEKVGLNLSRLSLLDNDFSEWLLTKLHHHREVCTRLVIEIPERALVQDAKYLENVVSRLKALGVEIAVEHFGAQLASFSHLQKLKPKYLKIDGKFTRDIDQHQDNQLFVSSLTSIAESLSIDIIAEMVESEAELSWLSSCGIKYFQGYHISRPMPLISN
ncbi:bifunctional diguanylate cyclase/phosphodiesterase [Agaribacter marinus]|uniref:GGDEF domain-containing protein n=1 Tax=Agaribacter marinus TaxID=1431249 RepID=A0AA37T0J8_9ALTE|nr:EAL domain-containing protein [Agaribacter marinus]GLR72876.1 GGDEF domain-containing protein [Agaribacter marinus]